MKTSLLKTVRQWGEDFWGYDALRFDFGNDNSIIQFACKARLFLSGSKKCKTFS